MIRVSIALRLMVAVVLFLPSASRAQVGFDRRGGDYTNFPVRSGDPAICAAGCDYRNLEVAPSATGETCKAACDAETQCRAWTYVRPGYLSTEARCYLKDHVMPPHHRPCCVSGVVEALGAAGRKQDRRE